MIIRSLFKWEQRDLFVPKDVSVILKGIAILTMLFLHLFNTTEKCSNLNAFFYIGNVPFCFWLSKITSICVPLYMFLSGYGLYIVYRDRMRMENFKRVGNLYTMVLMVAIVFFPLSYWFPSNGWDFDLAGVLKTLSGYNPYNAEWWFLFPWAIICLLSKYLFELLDKFKWSAVNISIFIYFLLRLLIWKIGDTNLVEGNVRWIYQLMQIFILACPFILGAVFACRGWLWSILSYQKSVFNSALFFIVGLTIAILRMFFIPIGIFDTFIAVIFVVVCTYYIGLFKNSFVCLLLNKIGKQSTFMWLTHTFFSSYYWKNFIYSSEIPMIIYILLIVVSYGTALVFDRAYKYLIFHH